MQIGEPLHLSVGVQCNIMRAVSIMHPAYIDHLAYRYTFSVPLIPLIQHIVHPASYSASSNPFCSAR